MAYNQAEIVQLATQLLGQPAVNSSNQSQFAERGNDFFRLIYEADIAQSDYSFAAKWIQLNLNAIPPNFNYWLYQCTLPSDYIKLIEVFPCNINQFDIVSNKTFYANVQSTQMKYVFLPRVEEVPIYYANFLIFQTAGYLAHANLMSPDLIKDLKAEASAAKHYAMSIDGQARPNSVFRNSRWTSYAGYSAGNYPYYNFFIPQTN